MRCDVSPWALVRFELGQLTASDDKGGIGGSLRSCRDFLEREDGLNGVVALQIARSRIGLNLRGS
jgi:hypothetical protein